MNAPTPINPFTRIDGGVIADASRVTPRQFIDAMLGTSDETRAAHRASELRLCTAIVRGGGSLRGWPQYLVDEARAIIAAEGLPVVNHLGREGCGL